MKQDKKITIGTDPEFLLINRYNEIKAARDFNLPRTTASSLTLSELTINGRVAASTIAAAEGDKLTAENVASRAIAELTVLTLEEPTAKVVVATAGRTAKVFATQLSP